MNIDRIQTSIASWIIAIAISAVICAISLSIPVFASDASDDDLNHGVGIAFSGSTIYFDIDRGGQGSRTFDGWGIFGKYGITEHWAVLASYRDLGDNGDLDPGEEISFNLIDIHASFTWLVTQHSRWHVKAGLAQLDFDSSRPFTGTNKDSIVSPSIGGGFEWGGRKIRLFVDFGVAFPSVELIPGERESLVVGNTNTGLIFKF